MLCAAAADCSTRAALRWVNSSISVMALLTSSMPLLWRWLAAVMSFMISVTCWTEATISPMVRPALSASSLPVSILATESSISCLISRAAVAERCARPRTSVATTAKPRPCSPARAASTAAFRARILVWKAMPSMTAMISTMRPELALIEPIVSTTWPTTRPPSSATFEVDSTIWLAWCAWLAFSRTVSVKACMDVAVSCKEWACDSVRADKSALPSAISLASTVMVEPAWRISPNKVFQFFTTVASARDSLPTSSSPRASMRMVRSPAARLSAARHASSMGPTTERATQVAIRASKAKPMAMVPSDSQPARWPAFFVSCKRVDSAMVEVEQYLAQLSAHLLVVSWRHFASPPRPYSGPSRPGPAPAPRWPGSARRRAGPGRFRGGTREFLEFRQALRDGVQLAIRLRAELLELLVRQAGGDGNLRIHVGMHLAQGNSLLVGKPLGRQGDVFQLAHALLVLLHGEVGQGPHGQQASQRDHRDDQHLLCDFHRGPYR